MTQKGAIVQYIRDKGSISSWEAYIHLGVTQLATRISELKDRGYEFSKIKEKRTGRYGRTVMFDNYSITKYGEEIK